MALGGKKSGNIHNLSGSDKAKLQAKFDGAEHDIISTEPDDFPILASIMYTIQNLSEDIDSLRTFTDTELKNDITSRVSTSGNETIAGTKTFSSTISGSINGNAGTATSATNAKGYKGSNTDYMLMPKDFYMMNSTSNYTGGFISVPSGGECHAQLSLPLGSSLNKQTLTISSSQVIASVVTVYAVPFDGVSSTLIMATGGALGKAITLSGSKFNASTHYVWIKINLNDDDSSTRIYGGRLGFSNS